MTLFSFPAPLIEARFIKRYKRFLVDATLPDGTLVTAHCANTGSMKGLLTEGNTVWLRHHNDTKRKLPYSLELIDAGTSLVGVNTALPNHMVQQSLQRGEIPQLSAYKNIRPEVKYGTNSRIDLLLQQNNLPDCYVEIKNTTLREDDAAVFPDAVTTRGQKHLDELVAMVQQGHRAVMFYLVQRSDCRFFRPGDDIDPAYGTKLRHAVQAGVDVLCYACDVTPQGITLHQQLEVRL